MRVGLAAANYLFNQLFKFDLVGHLLDPLHTQRGLVRGDYVYRIEWVFKQLKAPVHAKFAFAFLGLLGPHLRSLHEDLLRIVDLSAHDLIFERFHLIEGQRELREVQVAEVYLNAQGLVELELEAGV